LEAHGLRGGKPAAALSGLTQLAAGMSIATGLVPPFGSPAIGVILVAITTKAAYGLWVQHDGMKTASSQSSPPWWPSPARGPLVC
jgi:hypothetical protein